MTRPASSGSARLGALMPALRKLARVARGLEKFKGDHQERACIALARLAPGLLAGTAVESGTLGYHPAHTPAEAARLLAKIRAHEEARETNDAFNDDDNDQLVEES